MGNWLVLVTSNWTICCSNRMVPLATLSTKQRLFTARKSMTVLSYVLAMLIGSHGDLTSLDFLLWRFKKMYFKKNSRAKGWENSSHYRHWICFTHICHRSIIIKNIKVNLWKLCLLFTINIVRFDWTAIYIRFLISNALQITLGVKIIKAQL